MKRLSSILLFLLGSCAAVADAPVPAPTSPGTPPASDSGTPNRPGNPGHRDSGQWLSFLTPTEREQMETDHQKALADDPSLKQEEQQLQSDREAMRDSTPTKDERMAFREKMRTHQQKMREAMLKEDPSLAPVIQKIEQHMSEARAARDRPPPAPSAAPASAPSTNKGAVAPPVPMPSST